MNDFFMSALPWVVMGLCLAVFAACFAGKKKKQRDGDEESGNYMAEGMCVGMALGVAMGSQFDSQGLSLSIGMMIGMTVGMCIKKEKKM